MTRYIDDFSNTANRVLEHVIGVGKCLVLRDVVTEHFEQFLIEHHDQRIDIGFKLGQAGIRIAHAPAAFKLKGLGDDAHCEDAHLARQARNHRRRAGPGATAHAGRNEEHVRAFYRGADVVNCQFCSFATAFRFTASAKTAAAKLNRAVRRAAAQGLRVGIGANKFNALNR